MGAADEIWPMLFRDMMLGQIRLPRGAFPY
jgi:hypothetical protein